MYSKNPESQKDFAEESYDNILNVLLATGLFSKVEVVTSMNGSNHEFAAKTRNTPKLSASILSSRSVQRFPPVSEI